MRTYSRSSTFIRDLPVHSDAAAVCRISDMWFAEDRLVSGPNQSYPIEGTLTTLVRFYKGPERVKGLYAFRSIIDHGARITLGSDFPVEDMNPLAGFYAAITRVSPDGTSPHGPGGWYVHSMPLSVIHERSALTYLPC